MASFCRQVDVNQVRCLKHLSFEIYSLTWTIKAISFISISYEKSASRNYSIRDSLKFCRAPNKIDGTENNYVEDRTTHRTKSVLLYDIIWGHFVHG
jgi:hypothetical protein